MGPRPGGLRPWLLAPLKESRGAFVDVVLPRAPAVTHDRWSAFVYWPFAVHASLLLDQGREPTPVAASDGLEGVRNRTARWRT